MGKLNEDELELKHRKEQNVALLDDNRTLKKSLENAEKEAKEAKEKLIEKEQEIASLKRESKRREDELETAYARIDLIKDLPSKEAKLVSQENEKKQLSPEEQKLAEIQKYAEAAKAFN